MKKTLFLISTTISFLSILHLPAYAGETLCGWLLNPTPANWYLIDKDGRWIISTQGGAQARGMENIGDISEGEYIKTNGNYGYACACMEANKDRKNKRIISIQSFEQLPLKTCRDDRNLPKKP